ncbi:MAG TPA: hypothetical protein VE153_15960 [Myxococcus sp.]|jgi:hypothetical protein|nr:hypothetical protein [Myxococcus sp.]
MKPEFYRAVLVVLGVLAAPPATLHPARHGGADPGRPFSVGSWEVNAERDMVVDLRTFTTRVQGRG